jgi:AcrR family transcriptional regulator
MTGSGDWRTLFHTIEEFENAPPLRFAIENFLQEDGITLIGALAGHAKTMVMLAMVQALLEQTPLFNWDTFAVSRLCNRVLYLIPESSIGPFWARLKLFRLEEHIRSERLFVHTLSAKQQVLLTDPRLLRAAAGADLFLDTAIRFMNGEEDAESSRTFAQTLFALQAAGARTITGAHHAPKGFETQDRMTLENILRGSGDIGAMLATAWGLRQIDAQTNRIYVANVKDRDFQACEPFIIEGRPHLDEMGRFKMVMRPGEAKELRAYLSHTRPGRAASADKEDKLQQVLALRAKGRSFQQIADALNISKGTVSKWLNKHDESFPNRFQGNGNDEQRNRDGEEGIKGNPPPSGDSEPFPTVS